KRLVEGFFEVREIRDAIRSARGMRPVQALRHAGPPSDRSSWVLAETFTLIGETTRGLLILGNQSRPHGLIGKLYIDHDKTRARWTPRSGKVLVAVREAG